MRNHFMAIVATLALLCTSGPVSASTFPQVGGPGDAGFEDHCPANQYLIGLAGRAGAWINQIQSVCAPILRDGTHGAKYYGPSHGGGGGTGIEFVCPTDSVVFSAKIYLLDSEHGRVHYIELGCGSMQADRQAYVDFGTNLGEDWSAHEVPQLQQCVGGELGSGMHGRYGKDVNAVGLNCDARATVDQAVSAATPLPIKLTGRPAASALACPQGFVWREASSTDHVCVTPMQRRIAASQNADAATHVSATDQTYGPNTCVAGYVWREAFSGDVVCVTPPERDDVANENANAPAQVPGH